MRLIDHISPERVMPEMSSSTKEESLAELARLLAGPEGEERVAGQVLKVLKEREDLASTGIGDGIAIPHGKMDLDGGGLALGLARCLGGVDFDAVDEKPVHLMFVLVAPENSTGQHLKALARISRLCREPGFKARLLEAGSDKEMLEILEQEERKYWSE
jgi:nitrogen PTS system EIIA component